ncbi:sulfotransferase family protein [Sphingomonas japonica]|uniref:sulfotransferase family protein n=1 Tax=Sphingomonas japonica TaxID=511662 RepID=UPI001FD14B9D|nr:sulfotransferase [Sphingomonas japonica]
MAQYLFIVGLPRSGTKLLRDLLKNHSKIAILANETDLYPVFRDFFTRKRGEDWFELLWQQVGESKFFIRRNNAGDPIDPAHWKSLCPSATAAGAMKGLILASIDRTGDEIILGDKSPLHITCVREILGDFPDAKVLHIVRDGREVALSAIQAWKKDPLRAIQQWTDAVMSAHHAGSAVPDRFLTLRFEDLKSNPTRTLEAACAFLGLEYEPGMADLKGSAEGLGRARGKTQVMNLPDRAESLGPRQLKRMEEIFVPASRLYGYALKTSARRERRLSAIQMQLRRVMDIPGVVRFHIRQFGWIEGTRYVLRK